MYYLLKLMKLLVRKKQNHLKNTGKMGEKTGKVGEFCQSGKVGTRETCYHNVRVKTFLQNARKNIEVAFIGHIYYICFIFFINLPLITKLSSLSIISFLPWYLCHFPFQRYHHSRHFCNFACNSLCM